MFIRKLSDWMLFLLPVDLAVNGCHSGVRPVAELQNIPRITKEELRDKLGDPLIAIIDVRYTPNRNKSDRKIASAVREDHKFGDIWFSAKMPPPARTLNND